MGMKKFPIIPHNLYTEPERNIVLAMFVLAVKDEDWDFIRSQWAKTLADEAHIDIDYFLDRIPKRTGSGYVNVFARIPKRLQDLAKQVAKDDNTSVSRLWAKALIEYLSRRETNAESKTGVE